MTLTRLFEDVKVVDCFRKLVLYIFHPLESNGVFV